jgi:NAD-dependent DNA ligase
MSTSIKEQINNINSLSNSELQEFFNSSSISLLKEIKSYTDDIYYNTGGDSGLTDEQYDILKDIIITRDIDYVPEIGAIVRETENRVRVPYHMGSMDKIRPDKKEDKIKLRRWIKKYSSSYIIQDKLDGVSCLIVVQNGEYKLYKRPGSDGYGADITYLLPNLKSIPKNLNNIAVRGELIMSKTKYNKKYTELYKNPRNMVSGLTSSKKIGVGLKDIDFVVYEKIDDSSLTPIEKLKEMKELGFQVVNHEMVNEISMDDLCESLIKFKTQSPYEIDGIIIQSNTICERNTDGNPDYSFAFKMNVDSNIKETEVISVEWNVSKWGSLKPRVQVQPVHIGGVIIQYATGFYGKFIRDNGIGPGAIVKVTRSNDVIPLIVDVVRKTEPSMPTIPYKWNESGIEIYTDQEGKEISIKKTISFFSGLNIKFIGESVVRKLYEAGFDNLFKIIGVKPNQIASIDGLGNKSAERICTNIKNRLDTASQSDILGASGVFGYGINNKKVDKLLVAIPDFLSLKESPEDLIKRIKAVEGFSTKTATVIVQNLEKANEFLRELNKVYGVVGGVKEEKKQEVETKTNNLNNLKIVCTGFRDLENEIMLRGGTVLTAVSKNTDMVVVKNLNDKPSIKVSKAIQLGIQIIQKDEFIQKYLN